MAFSCSEVLFLLGCHAGDGNSEDQGGSLQCILVITNLSLWKVWAEVLLCDLSELPKEKWPLCR